MEPITHILAGACMSRAGLKSKTALSTVTMVIAAEIADVDLLYSLRGPVAGFQHHRGWTHSVAAMPLMAVLSVALVWVWYRLFPRKVFNRIAPAALDRPRMPVRWVLLYGYACLAVLSHLLLDYTTSYGVRLFEPFSFKWYSWDIVYMAEPFMWVVLAGAGCTGAVGAGRLSNFVWHGVVETSDSFKTVEVNMLDAGIGPADHSRAYYKP